MITMSDVLPNPEFVARRPQLEREIIRAKGARRLAVGDHLTFLFENKATLLWQIQEMCRVEHITSPAAVQHEIDTYGPMLPGPSELSGTLLIEYTEVTERDEMLRKLLGLHEHVWLEAGGERCPARFDDGQFDTVRVSSVQFVRIPLTAKARAALFDLAQPAAIVVDHPAMSVRAALPPVLRGALVEDLASAT